MEAVSRKKKLRIQKYPASCGRGFSLSKLSSEIVLTLCYSIDCYDFRVDLLKTGFTLTLKVIRQLCIYFGFGFTTV